MTSSDTIAEKNVVVNEAYSFPTSVQGMTELDRSLFQVCFTVPAVRCPPKLCSLFQKNFKNILLNRPRFPNIVKDPNDSENKFKLVLLKGCVQGFADLTDAQQADLQDQEIEFTTHDIQLTYEDFSAQEIMNAVLSNSVDEVVSAFETIGHIAHLNLKKDLLPYKQVIGAVLLDKNAHIKTVVNKTESIDETFRFFKMELLAGEDNMLASVRQHGCRFEFDFSKVYWNSRLQTEHKFLVEQVRPRDIVVDVFAGVGPFAVPMGKKKCSVYANDLNPESYKALCHNIQINKVSQYVHPFNMDGRKFLEEVVIPKIRELEFSVNEMGKSMRAMTIIMNLPAIAPEFLDVFKEKYETYSIPLILRRDIIVHCYCFSKHDDPVADAQKTVENCIGHVLGGDVQARVVRRVAPNKVMLCVSFNLLWFADTEKCSCETRDHGHYRKRPLEGGEYPMYASEPKVRELDCSSHTEPPS